MEVRGARHRWWVVAAGILLLSGTALWVSRLPVAAGPGAEPSSTSDHGDRPVAEVAGVAMIQGARSTPTEFLDGAGIEDPGSAAPGSHRHGRGAESGSPPQPAGGAASSGRRTELAGDSP
ncbi:MAG: hypothetical protein PVI35_03365 [Acidimicrobiia bacterium]